ncbi:hypothetical protein AHAS_Ahas16G0208300 [Arachis hypogaea]
MVAGKSNAEVEEVLDQMLTCLALCDDSKLEPLLSKLLPLYILSLSLNSAAVYNKKVLIYVLERGPTPKPLCQVMLRVGDLKRSIEFYEKSSFALEIIQNISFKLDSQNMLFLVSYAIEFLLKCSQPRAPRAGCNFLLFFLFPINDVCLRLYSLVFSLSFLSFSYGPVS